MATQSATGGLRKMHTALESPVSYKLPIGDEMIAMNPLLGQKISLQFLQSIHCIHCGRKTKKSFNQGYCYPCFTKLAQCDSCIVHPEKCHYAEGTCREPEWGQEHCMIDHFVYLANSSGIKVGITRGTQIPTRWMDQGAIQAIPVIRVDQRFHSGLVEVVFKAHVADKTNWRAMLKGEVGPIDLLAQRDALLAEVADDIRALQDERGVNNFQIIDAPEIVEISYPVIEHPTKVSSFNFDKTAVVEGTLMGIKGQYLMLDTGVINIRKFAGYDVELKVA